jgi:hypothetical protein
MKTRQNPSTQQPESADAVADMGCTIARSAGVSVCDALMNLARLLGRQAAAEFLPSQNFNALTQEIAT